jgi:hypothetical protein
MQNLILQVSIDKIKVDFVKYDYNLLEEIKSEEGIKYLGKKDISANLELLIPWYAPLLFISLCHIIIHFQNGYYSGLIYVFEIKSDK